MAHNHFNGTCEQSARNYHGAISRNFGFENKLDARLSCQKPTGQYVRGFSGCLVPLEYDEDPEYETERGIFIKNGYARVREVRAFCNESVVFAPERPQTFVTNTSRPVLSDEVQAILRKVTRKETVSRKEAQQVTNFILTCPRIAKPIRDKFVSRKIGALQALRLAGLYSVKK